MIRKTATSCTCNYNLVMEKQKTCEDCENGFHTNCSVCGKPHGEHIKTPREQDGDTEGVELLIAIRIKDDGYGGVTKECKVVYESCIEAFVVRKEEWGVQEFTKRAGEDDEREDNPSLHGLP